MQNTKTLSILGVQVYIFDLISYSLALILPILLHANQIITGIIINTLLFTVTARFSFKQIMFISMLPSIGALVNGYLFGPQTAFLYFFLPFIWVGNMIMLYIYKQPINSGTVRVILSTIAKVGLLYLIANIYVALHIVPNIFLSAMGLMQLITAVVGGLIALLIFKTKKYGIDS